MAEVRQMPKKRENEYTFNYDTFYILCLRRKSIYLTNKVYEGLLLYCVIQISIKRGTFDMNIKVVLRETHPFCRHSPGNNENPAGVQNFYKFCKWRTYSFHTDQTLLFLRSKPYFRSTFFHHFLWYSLHFSSFLQSQG